MSDIDYNLLGGQGGGEPSEGIYRATLVRAALVDTDRGSSLVTEWQTAGETPYYWTTWFGFQPNRVAITQEFLDSIGIDRAAMMRGDTQGERDQSFSTELWGATNIEYQVEVTTWAKGVNTKVLGAAGNGAAPAVQQQLSDVEILDQDLPRPGADAAEREAAARVGAGARTSDDDDIPF